MIPGEMFIKDGEIELNAGREALEVEVANTGDRPVQVGSHYHFFEVNPALSFDRDAAYGFRLNVPAGTAVRFEPGEVRTVDLVPLGGAREVHGLSALTNGPTTGDHRAAVEAFRAKKPLDSVDFTGE